MEPEAHCGGNMRAANEDAGAVAFAADTARGSHSVPGGAGGQDDPGDPARPGDAIIHGVPGGVGDLNNPRGPSAAGESDGTVGVIPQFPGAPQVPGPGRDTAPRAGILSNRPLQLYPIPGASVGRAAAVWSRGGLGGCRWWGLKYRRRVLWRA